MVLKHCHVLTDESTRAAVVLRAWSEVPSIVVERDILELYNNKCRRSKGIDTSVATAENTIVIWLIVCIYTFSC